MSRKLVSVLDHLGLQAIAIYANQTELSYSLIFRAHTMAIHNQLSKCTIIAASLMLPFTCHAGPTFDEPDPINELFQGKWQLVSSIKGGKVRYKEGDPSGVVIEIVGDKITSRSTETGAIVGKSVFEVDPSKEPFKYKLTPQTDILAGLEFKGLCKVENDRMTLCTSNDPNDDLTKFTSPHNSMISVAVYSRVK